MKRVWAKGADSVRREDQRILIEMGTAVSTEYAARAGCSHMTAYVRLMALVEHGLAERYKRPGYGSVNFFVATAPPGSTVREP
jgi:hypothetical protein